MQTHTRRAFLQSAGSVGLAATLDASFPRLLKADAMGLPPGIQLYSVRTDIARDTPGTLKQLRTTGFVEVETAGFGRYSAKEFRGMLDDAGLRVPSAHLRLTPTSCGPAFDDAHTLGAHFATSSSLQTSLHPPNLAGLAPGQRPTMELLGLDGFKKLADAMNDIGRQAKAAGLEYAYHNHNYEFEKMPDGGYGYDVLVNATDADIVKFEIDCGWMSVAGADPVAYMRRYAGRFRMIHVKEFQPVSAPVTRLFGPERPKGTDLGTGFIDYSRIFAAGREAGIEHAFAEQEDPFPVSQMASAQAAFRFLRQAS
jgi:sugar phosphate isomerase/epimerase